MEMQKAWMCRSWNRLSAAIVFGMNLTNPGLKAAKFVLLFREKNLPAPSQTTTYGCNVDDLRLWY